MLLDEVVAVVDTRFVLLSELMVETRLVRARREGPAALERPLDDAALAAGLDALIDRLVVHGEAERLQVFEVSAAQARAEVESWRQSIGPARLEAFLRRYEVDEHTLNEVVSRHLRVSRYLEGRFRLAARPRESDVEMYVAAHPDLSKRPYDQVAPEVRDRLARERFQTLTQAFTADVRRRARVRLLRQFQSGQQTPYAGEVTARGPVGGR